MCFGSKSSAKKITTGTSAASSGDNNTAHEEMMSAAMGSKPSSSSSKTYDSAAPSRSLRPKSRSRKSPVSSLLSVGSLAKASEIK